MEMPLLQTKLYIPPPRSELVPRSRLVERLNAGLWRNGLTGLGPAHKLTLISAPAGFGKTTLVSEWVANLRLGAVGQATATDGVPSPIAIAWLSFDESDNDLTRFLTYLIAALRTIKADVAEGVLSALHAPQPQLPATEAILTVLINEIAALPDRIVLVLDDYHLIGVQPIHDALTFLLRRLPPQLHLVIATREDPPLPLARLRARGQLTELRATDLRFTSSEAAEFLNQVMGLDLSAEDIAALERRTEGWIAGLQLAAVSMQGRKDVTAFIQSFTGSHHYVLDYLVEEVLEQQSESVRTFLLQTAILDRLTGSLCDALTGQNTGRTTLEMLEHANLFLIPLDDEHRWYRYHHLFADLIRQRLRQTQLEQVPALHIRASVWYEQNGFIDQSIGHALRAEDVERAAVLIEQHVDAIWQRGEHTRLRRWLAGIPVELLSSKPHLCILRAWNLFTSGRLDAAEQSLQAAENALELGTDRVTGTSPRERDQPPGFDEMRIQGRVAAIRAFLASYWGDVQKVKRYAHQALEHLPEQDLTWRSAATVALGDAYSFAGELTAAYQARLEAVEVCKAAGNIYMLLIANMKLTVTLRQQGQLRRAIEICQQQLQLAQEIGMSEAPVIGWSLAIWGEALAELDDLDRAIHRAKKGVELTERGKNAMTIGWSNLCLIRVLFSRGELTAAQEIIKKMENTARQHDAPPWITNLMVAWQARIWLAQDRLDAASEWVVERGLDIDGVPTYMNEKEYMVLARILIVQERLDKADLLLQHLLEATETGGRSSRMIEVLLMQALIFQSGGDVDQAITVLERAFNLADPGGFIRIFVDEGPPMAHLLYEAATRGIAPDYVRRLLAAFPDVEPEKIAPSSTQIPKSDLIEPLSEREIQVLQLIAEGLTNREVASRLFLAVNTVKAHAGNIYGKLGVHSRTQAVAKARTLGLLPST
jgi:LuxR family maltose regulon positive regulatory protein